MQGPADDDDDDDDEEEEEEDERPSPARGGGGGGRPSAPVSGSSTNATAAGRGAAPSSGKGPTPATATTTPAPAAGGASAASKAPPAAAAGASRGGSGGGMQSSSMPAVSGAGAAPPGRMGGVGTSGVAAAAAAAAAAGGGTDTAARSPPRRYDPSEFAGLAVSGELRDLFRYIERFKPHDIELETKLRCFVPDFVPALGEMDGFLKPPRPDGQEERLGVEVLDEPGPRQSDPSVLELQLRALSKKSHLAPASVRSIEHADKNPKEIQRWIENVEALHRAKPAPQVHYSRAMPDVETLMQEWPAEFEALLRAARLPDARIDLSVDEFARVACAIVDVPVYDSIIQSMHFLFTLYHEFRTNQHFAQVGAPPG